MSNDRKSSLTLSHHQKHDLKHTYLEREASKQKYKNIYFIGIYFNKSNN
jgi:hypothetical protein